MHKTVCYYKRMKRGKGPHPQPWPEDDRLDPQLLAEGDYRNVVDKYRYWRVDAIREDLARHSIELEVAIENVTRDFNHGTIVRNANAFNVRRVHIVGRRGWNKRGAMKTDAYLDVMYHESIEAFVAATSGKQRLAIDITEDALPLPEVSLPSNAVLVFGAEGPGLSEEMIEVCDQLVAIPQFGSTRSVNVGVASGILMYKWAEQHLFSN